MTVEKDGVVNDHAIYDAGNHGLPRQPLHSASPKECHLQLGLEGGVCWGEGGVRGMMGGQVDALLDPSSPRKQMDQLYWVTLPAPTHLYTHNHPYLPSTLYTASGGGQTYIPAPAGNRWSTPDPTLTLNAV